MIYVIGIGIEGRKSLTNRALEIISRAGLVIGGRRHLDEFRDSKAVKASVTGDLDSLVNAIKEFRKKRRGKVAVLATGDPLLYGIASFILRKFGKKNVEVIPNVSTVHEAFARIKEDANGLKVLSAHGRKTDIEALSSEIVSHDKVALFTDPENPPSKVAGALLKKGAAYRAFVAESIGTDKEKIFDGSLRMIARKRSFSPLSVMILIKDKKKSAALRKGFGIPDGLFSHSSGMITKEELRVIALSKLDINDSSTVWDIGACSGSVSIEAALNTIGSVYAVEKDLRRVSDIKNNKKRFKTLNLDIMHGIAPACLKKIAEDPDAVFVGGGGRDIGAILSYVSKRLKKGGRVVVNAVTIETAYRAFEGLKTGYERELIQVGLSKARSVGELNLLQAHNPVFIIRGVKL